MARKPSQIIYPLTILFLSFFLFSCSTIHHTIPPRPLPYHEFRSDFLISYDFNSTDVLPDFGMNFYWGVGKEYNLGLGYNPPLGISHLTMAKYFDSHRENVNYIFSSIDGLPFSLIEHPSFELGGGTIMKSENEFHSISAGLWLAFYNERVFPTWFPLGFPIAALMESDSISYHFSPGTFIKYQYSNDNMRLSLQNYMGFTARKVELKRLEVMGRSTKYEFKNSDIDSIRFSSNWYPPGYAIYMNYPFIYTLGEYLPYDYWTADMDLFIINRFRLDDSTRAYYLIKGQQWYAGGPHYLYEVNGEKLIRDYENGKNIVLQYNPENTEKIMHKIKWYLSDWSVGVAWKYK